VHYVQPGGSSGAAKAVGVQELDRQQLNRPGDPGDAESIVAEGSGDAGYMRAMAVVVLRIGIGVCEVPAMQVVDVAFG
jgi:hypothetical protein